MVHRGREQDVERAHRDHGDPDRQGQRPVRVLRLAPGLGDGVEADEAREEERRRCQERSDTEWRAGGDGHLGALPCREGGGEVGVVEREAGDDHDAPQREHQEHERDQGPLVELDAPQVDAHERPEEPERDPHSGGTRVERHGQSSHVQCRGDIPEKRDHHVGHHSDGDRESEPLGEAGHEAQVRVERPAGVDVAAAGPRHGRREDRVGQRREHGGQSRVQVRRQDVGTDPRNAPLDHDGDDVDGRPEHRADAGGGQPQEPELPSQSGGCAVGGRGRGSLGHRAMVGAPDAIIKGWRPAAPPLGPRGDLSANPAPR